MPNFRETRACIAYAYQKSFINEQEFVLLYDFHKSTNPEFPYWNYERFDLDEKTNDECKADFRFYRDDIYKLAEQLQLPDEITTYNGLVVASVPALCMYLKRYAYPCRYGDLVCHFARPVPELSIITNHMKDLIYGRWHHLQWFSCSFGTCLMHVPSEGAHLNQLNENRKKSKTCAKNLIDT